MKTFNTYYHDKEHFRCFLHDHAILDTPNLLVQVFGSLRDEEEIRMVIATISSLLPSAHILGATGDGEILDASVSIHTLVLSITQFDHTTLRSYGLERQEHCHALGASMARALVTPSTKAIITFTDGLNTNGEAYLNGMDTLATKVFVAGGLAGDAFHCGVTFVFTKDFISSNGAVGVSLNSTSLHVHSYYNFNWVPIGKELTITHAKGNRVYTIDNKTACDTYAYYLGEDIGGKIPNINTEFPLVLTKDGISLARAALGKKEDGSILFAGNVQTGDKVRIGFGNIEQILDDALTSFNQAKEKPVESLFIYSCMARRRYMQEACSLEIAPWTHLAPSCGFFTYGEFFTAPSYKKYLMNQTMTILALSERDSIHKHSECKKKEFHVSARMADFASSMKALSRFINITSEELAQANQRLKCAIDGSKDGLWSWNLQTLEVYFSPRFKEMLGYEENAFKNNMTECFKRVHPEDKKRIVDNIKACSLGKKEEYNEVFRMRHKNGSWVWIHSRGTFFRDPKGTIIQASGFHTDVTEEKNEAAEKEEQRRFFQSVINGIDASVVVVDPEENIILTNKSAHNFFVDGLFSDPKNPTYKEIYHQKSLETLSEPSLTPMQTALQSAEVILATTQRQTRHSGLCDIEIVITPLLDANNLPMGAIEVAHDISEHLSLQRELEIQKQHFNRLAQCDSLTGLPNRFYFSGKLSEILTKAKGTEQNTAILFIDLDKFKHINDTLGHDAGDSVLQEMAKRFQDAIRSSDTLARLGGDEFVIIMEKVCSEKDCLMVAEKIIANSALPIFYKQQPLTMNVSIGIALSPKDGKDAKTLLQHADLAMYKAKEKEGNTAVFFT